MNEVKLQGWIGSEPIYREFQRKRDGKPVLKARFLLRVRRRQGGYSPVPVVAWNELAAELRQQGEKGQRIEVRGEISAEFWSADASKERGDKLEVSVLAEEITYLEPKGQASPPPAPVSEGAQPVTPAGASGRKGQ